MIMFYRKYYTALHNYINIISFITKYTTLANHANNSYKKNCNDLIFKKLKQSKMVTNKTNINLIIGILRHSMGNIRTSYINMLMTYIV